MGQYDEALRVAQEAVQFDRKLAENLPTAFLPKLAVSLNQERDLSKPQPALRNTRSALRIYQRLARKNPDTFLPDLAMGYTNLGNSLHDVGLQDESLKASEEAVRTLMPFFFRDPAAFGSRMELCAGNYVYACEALGREPDQGLLEPILEALEIGGT